MSTTKPIPIREDKKHKIETHVAGICLRYNKEEAEILIAKRKEDRELFPGKWECGGGQVKVGENFKEALKRQFFEEFCIMVNVIQLFRTYEIILPNKPKIPGLKFICIPEGEGHEKIEINPREFSEFKWVSIYESKKLDFISGIHKDIVIAVSIFKQLFPNKEILKKKISS